jgi:PTS system cellobiose-specific IIC component
MQTLMEKLEKVLNKYLMPVADKINGNKVITAIKDGMMFSLPVTLIASIALIFSYFPFLSSVAPNIDAGLRKFFAAVQPATLGILAIYVIIGAATSYSKSKKIEPLYGIICALASFFIVTPFTTTTDVIVNNETVKNAIVSNIIPTNNLGASGVFPALIVTFCSIGIYSWLHNKNFTIKMPDAVPDNVAKPFLSIIPMGAAVLVFLIVRNLFEMTSFGTLQNFIDQILTKPLLGFGNNIWVFLFLIFIAQILWFFGIHGTNVVLNAVWQPIAMVAMAANLEAFNAGHPLPYLLTAAFTAYTGQAKLSEIVALVTLGKSQQAKAIGKVSLVPALFNIHEPFVFGLPVIMNTTLMIPWMLVESIQAGIAYAIMVVTGAVPIIQAPWTTPPIIQQLIATNFNPWSALIPIVTFVVGFVLWAPFIKLLDKQYLEAEKN